MNKKVISQRFLLVSILFLILFCVLATRLFDVQVMQGDLFLKKAEQNRFYRLTVHGNRGVFFDRYGDPIVLNNEKYYRVDRPDFLTKTRTPITREEGLQLMATQSASIETSAERFYPYSSALAHVLGYVGGVTAADLRRDETLSSDQQIGKAGLESLYDEQLRGRDGEQIYEVNAVGQKQRLVQETAAMSGQDLTTSLDPYLSEVAQQAMGTQRGALIVTDSQTGEVLALTSSPSFDPNVLSKTYPEADKEQQRRSVVQNLFADPQNIFFNRAISGNYPPGSIFKIVTALAGLESEKVNLSTQVLDEGKIKLGNYIFGNWYYRQYGKVEGQIGIVRAIARSNDIFFYKVAEWTGPNAISTMAHMLGFGAKTGIDLPGEIPGLVPDPDWKLRVKNEKWFLGDTYHYGIGQGDLLITPLQAAQMTQAISNNGTLCQLSVVHTDKRNCRDVNIKQENLKTVLDGMLGACSRGGTAFPFFPYNELHVKPNQDIDANIQDGAILCKTGTAEFGEANEKGYRKTHGVFTSIIGLPDFKNEASSSAQLTPDLQTLYQKWRSKVAVTGFPRRITITIFVESDDQNPYKEGSKDGGPIVKTLLYWMLGTTKP